MSLATHYRPSEFISVLGQKTIIQILEKQLESKSYNNCYLFCGASGCGKTTLARIFADKINGGKSSPIEIDAASNNGVDNIRNIVESSKERSVDSEYKIFILDEAHMLTNQSWNALLKVVEEPPKYTIFMFCTTDPQRIPSTILNRVMRFNLNKISDIDVEDRLNYICRKEGFTNFEESSKYIAKISNGGMRDAIANLEKVATYNTKFSIESTMSVLGAYSFNILFDVINSIADCDDKQLLSIIESIYSNGNDLKYFIDQLIDFSTDLTKYCIFKDMELLSIPSSMEEAVKYATGIYETQKQNIKYYNWLLDKLLNIKFNIKYDTSIKTTIEIMMLGICNGKSNLQV